LQEALYGTNSKKTASLTFRNDEWDAAQTKTINEAMSQNSNSREDKQVIGLKIKDRSESFDSSSQRGVRSRTRSAEAVGKAIGSFLQNLKENHHSERAAASTK
jgi:hypothetical protein